MTEEELVAFALKFRRKAKFYGHDRWPTLRVCAREFKAKPEYIEEMVYASDRLDLTVRFKVGDKYGGLPYPLWAVRVTDEPDVLKLPERRGPRRQPFT